MASLSPSRVKADGNRPVHDRHRASDLPGAVMGYVRALMERDADLPTLARLKAQGIEALVLHCCAPGWRHSAPIAFDQLPPDATVRTVSHKARCRACGGRGGFGVQVECRWRTRSLQRASQRQLP